VKSPLRNETSLVLAIAVIFSGVAIPVLSGFLEPSQPPAVAAVQIGDPSDRATHGDGLPRRSQTREIRTAPARFGRRATHSQKRERPARPTPALPAPPAPVDDIADDDGGEAD
jgi:hypothetical protein